MYKIYALVRDNSDYLQNIRGIRCKEPVIATMYSMQGDDWYFLVESRDQDAIIELESKLKTVEYDEIVDQFEYSYDAEIAWREIV